MLKKIPELVAQARQSLQTVSAENSTELCKKENGILIDVREPAEFAQKSVQGAINIPRGILEPTMLEKFPNEELAIFIHCASGARATFAAEQLQRVGYKHVWVITCKVDDVITAYA